MRERASCAARILWAICLTLSASGPVFALGEAVVVTARFDQSRVAPGTTDVLRVFAQIAPEFRTNAAGIVSWYVDLLNTRPEMAAARSANLVKAAADNDPLLSSLGIASLGSQVGIYDTFLNRPGAGVTNAIELFRVPVVAGTNTGGARFRISSGTGVSGLSADFLVETKDGTPPLSGADYTLAVAELVICDDPEFRIERAGQGGGSGHFNLRFETSSGVDYFVESRPGLRAGLWQTLPGAPHNLGSVSLTNSPNHRVFRLRLRPQ